LHELQRRHHQVRGAVTLRGLELEFDLSGGNALHPLVRQRRAGNVVAQLFQPLAVVRRDPAVAEDQARRPIDISTGGKRVSAAALGHSSLTATFICNTLRRLAQHRHRLNIPSI
jgi:hypothetical protein